MGRQGPLRPSLDRRRFVRQMTAGAAGLLLGRVGRSSPGGGLLASPAPGAGFMGPDGPGPLFGISLAQWSLHKALYDGELLGQPFRAVAKSFQVRVWRDLCQHWRQLDDSTRRSLEQTLPESHWLDGGEAPGV